jgi:flagellar biosynthesis/type III secretory pathway M-ring protein FliF/YscJ
MATVRVPRSYFVRVCKEINGEINSKDPTALKTVIDEELVKIRADVKACTGLSDDRLVMVESYVDATPLLAAAAPVASTPASTVPQLLTNHSKEVGIAVVGGAMLVVIVMATRRPAPLGADQSHEPMDLHSAEMLAGVPSVFDTIAHETETDPPHEMGVEVATIVKERPEAAANLVRQWLNR